MVRHQVKPEPEQQRKPVAITLILSRNQARRPSQTWRPLDYAREDETRRDEKKQSPSSET